MQISDMTIIDWIFAFFGFGSTLVVCGVVFLGVRARIIALIKRSGVNDEEIGG